MIYLMEAVGTGRFKIGYAIDPKRRLWQAKVYCPFPLRLVHFVPGTPEVEKTCHRMFQQYRIHGEWFELPLHMTSRPVFQKMVAIARKQHRLAVVAQRLDIASGQIYDQVMIRDGRWGIRDFETWNRLQRERSEPDQMTGAVLENVLHFAVPLKTKGN